MTEEIFRRNWETIKTGVELIFAQKSGNLSYEELYR